MTSDTRHRTRIGTLFRFIVRSLGLFGVLAAVAGCGILAIERPDVFQLRSFDQIEPTVRPLVEGASGVLLQVGAILLLAGVVVVLLWLLVELLSGLFLATGRKSAAGVGATLQVALAAALLVIVNALSFQYFARFDRTRDQRFTLDPALVEQLKTLDPHTPTTVVVVQKDVMSALEADQSDPLTTSAQQKITEKVLDMIDELREHPDLSARFNVHVIRTKDEYAEAALADLTDPLPARPGETDAERKARETTNREKAAIKAAVEMVPENSVLVAGNGRVQRLPFNQFYMLDKAASQAPPGGRSRYENLVLSPQGKAAFVQKMLDLEQRRPKVALLTIHPFLTSREADEEGAVFTAAGLRAALEQNGFEVTDVVLKKGWDDGTQISPAAATYDESKLDEVEADYLAASDALTEATIQVQAFELMKKRTQTGTLAELDRVFRRAVGREVKTEADREMLLTRLIQPNLELWQSSAEEAKKQLIEKEPVYLKYVADDRVVGSRRSTDVRAKLAAAVADCDLLVVPRLTTVNLVNRFVITPSLFNLVRDQTDAVGAFLAAGKPVLFGLGPTQVGRVRPGDEPGDEVERMLARLGIEAGSQTIVTTTEAAEMAKRRSGGAFGGKMPDLPPLQLELKPASGKPANPVAVAVDQTARTVRKKVEVKRSGYRPLYLSPAVAANMPYAPELLLTTADAWNEDRPLVEGTYVPKFEPTKPDDPKKGTREEEKKQQFLVGVAAEVPVPVEWTDPTTYVAAMAAGGLPGIGVPPAAVVAVAPGVLGGKDRPKVRVAVFGHGGLFNGPKLDPGQESLLLHTVNWQLKRDDRLPTEVADADKWRFPRVPLDDKRQRYWKWGTAAGLPLLAAFLGLLALMLRRLR
jgi:hypothetical protein